MMVRFLLVNRFPLILWWGPHYIQFYNDSYRPIPGTKHPKSLGQPASECWTEIWHIIGPLINRPFQGGPATWMEDILLEVNRHGFVEETHFTIAYSPVPDEAAPRGIGGVLGTVHEITEKVIGERRVTILGDLGAHVGEAKTAEEACAIAAETLGKHSQDVPFALIYLVDSNGKQAHLSGVAGTNIDEQISPRVVNLDENGTDQGSWLLAQAMQTETMQVIEDLGSCFPWVPPGPWSDPPHTAVVLPIPSNKAHLFAGLLVVGISSRLKLDQPYRSFLELMTTQIATVIANAQAYEEERKRAESLAELDRAKTTFFSNVSHEFRTPLTLLMSPMEELSNTLDDRLQPNEREQLQLMQRNGLRLQKLVNTLLDFSRIEAGRVQAFYERTDLATYTAELGSVFRSLIERAGMNLVIDCPALPEPVYIDRDMWEKIVLNLISNAFKFTFTGSITVQLQTVGNSVELSVSDTGVGIPEDELPRLFERFHRVSGTRSRTYEGSGIGLGLVQELVKLHGGTIRVTSQVDRGTTFTISIPFGTAHLPQDRIEATRTLASTALGANPYVAEASRWLSEGGNGQWAMGNGEELFIPTSHSPLLTSSPARILLADDNADMRDYLKRLLSQQYEVEVVADGIEALSTIRHSMPDLVLSDVMMPNLGGFELLRELRAHPSTQDLPFILLSARAGEEARIEGLEAGADDYLIKPFSARELLVRVEASLKLAQLRREAGAALRESEEHLRLFVTASSDIVYKMSADWSEMRRLEGKDFLASTANPSCTWLEQYIPLEDQPQVMAAIQAAIRTKSTFELEHRVIQLDGTIGWTFSRAIPLLNAQHEIVEWLGAASDITQRKRREANLAFLAEIQDDCARLTTADAMMQTIGAKIGAYLNLSVCAFVNIDEAQDRAIVAHAWHRADVLNLVGTYRISEFVIEEFYIAARAGAVVVVNDTNTDARTDAENCAAINVQAFIHVPFLRDGQWKFLLNVYDSRPRDWREDEIELFCELANRIFPRLERARAEADLRQSEQRFRRMADAMPQQVWMTDAQGNTQYVNQQWTAYTGLTLEQTQDIHSAAQVIHPDDFERTSELWRTALAMGTPYQAEFRLKYHADQTYRWFLSRAIAIRDEQGQIVQWFGTSTDIEAFRRAQAEREQLLAQEQTAREAAENANRIKDEFLAVLSHELRSPLNPILGWAKLLQQGKLDPARTKTALDTIDRNAQLQVQLIDDLLDISRILRGKLSLNVLPVNLSAVISAALETVHLAAEAKSLQIQTVIAPDVGAVMGDAGRLQQVVWNLLSNAVKFTPQAGQVTVALTQTQDDAQIQVIDMGKGIKPDFLPYVFEHFRQEDGTTTRKFGGLGLGLAIARQIVEMHGGQISVDSPGEGQGATFTIRIPLAPQSTQLPPTETSSASTLDLNGIQILVVDDEPDSRDFVAFVLEQTGAIVMSVASGIQALQAIEQAIPDLIVSDIGMPDMDGYMLLQQVRAIEQGTQMAAIALTAYAGEFDRQQALQAGFQKHLSKPIEPGELIQAISDLIGGSSHLLPDFCKKFSEQETLGKS